MNNLPPHSVDGEAGLLGCILYAPAESLAELQSTGKICVDSFYVVPNRIVYAALLDMVEKNEAIDIGTLFHKLKATGENIGLDYLSKLMDATPSPAGLGYFAEDVHQKHLLRKLTETIGKISGRVSAFLGNDVSDLLHEIEREVLSIAQVKTASLNTKELVQSSIARIEDLWQRKGAISGLSTGFRDLDRKTDGLHPGEMTVIAAFPSTGKTALAMNIAENVAVEQNQPVGVITLEMTGESLMTRLLCSSGRVNLLNVRDGFLTEADFPRLATAAQRLAGAPIYFDDENDASVSQVRSKARRMRQKHGIKLLVIDYLQLLSGGDRKENRQQEVADISRGLKSMAKELHIPVLALSQLNDEGKLRESRAIGQDADGIWMLEKPESEAGNERVYPVDLWIRKQRNGPRNVKIPLMFHAEFTRFENESKV